MRVPTRKSELERLEKEASEVDHVLSQEEIARLQRKLERRKSERPAAAAEVQHTASMGDFSENFGYQVAKGRLRKINDDILRIERTLATAKTLKAPTDTDRVQVGHTVTLTLASGTTLTVTLVTSGTISPGKGHISARSPLGVTLLNKSVGDRIAWTTPAGEQTGTLTSIQ